MGFLHSGYEPDFETTCGNARMCTIEMSVESRAGRKFQHLLFVIEQPYARKRRIEVPDHSYAQVCSISLVDSSLSLTAALTSACKTAWRANLASRSCRRLRSLMSRAIPVKKRCPSLVNSANEISSGISAVPAWVIVLSPREPNQLLIRAYHSHHGWTQQAL